MRRLTATCLALFLCLPATALLQAAPTRTSEGIDVELVCGYDNEVFTGITTPYVVRVRNTSGEDVEATLEVDENSPDGTRRLVRLEELELPDSSRKQFQFCVPQVSEGMTTELQFSLRTRRRVLWEHVVQPSAWRIHTAGNHNFILVVRRSSGPSATAVRSALPDKTVSLRARDLPVHDVALAPFTAVVVLPEVSGKLMTKAQAGALAHHLVGGGVVAVDCRNVNLRRRLRTAAPLTYDDDAATAPGLIPAGGGALVAYEGDRPQELVDMLPGGGRGGFFSRLPAARERPLRLAPNSLRFALILLGLGLLYLIFSGPVLITLKNARRRTRVVYTAALVGAFSVLALAFGLAFRNLRGSVRCDSLTELTPAGGVQEAVLDVRSSGGVRSDLELHGAGIDFWSVARQPSHMANQYYAYSHYVYSPALLWEAQTLAVLTPNRPVSALERRGKVPITPWARRRVLARCYVPEVKPLEMTFEVWPDAAARSKAQCVRRAVQQYAEKPGLADGQLQGLEYGYYYGRSLEAVQRKGKLRLVVTNTWTQPLADAVFVVRAMTAGLLASSTRNVAGIGGTAAFGPTECVQVIGLGPLAPGERREVELPVRLLPLPLAWTSSRHDKTVLNCRGLIRRGHCAGLLLATVETSPGLKVGDCGFVQTGGKHLVMQRVPYHEQPACDQVMISTDDVARILDEMDWLPSTRPR